jgi:hypothetical protein
MSTSPAAIEPEAVVVPSDNPELPPLVLHGRRFQLVDKRTLAARLSISEDTVDRWVAKGYLPQPIDPDRRAGRGRKILLWDLYECIERVMTLRRQ